MCVCDKQAVLVGQAARWQASAWAVLCALKLCRMRCTAQCCTSAAMMVGHCDASSPCSLQPNGGPTEGRLDCCLSLRAHIHPMPHLVRVDQEHTLCQRIDYWLPLRSVQHSCVHITTWTEMQQQQSASFGGGGGGELDTLLGLAVCLLAPAQTLTAPGVVKLGRAEGSRGQDGERQQQEMSATAAEGDSGSKDPRNSPSKSSPGRSVSRHLPGRVLALPRAR